MWCFYCINTKIHKKNFFWLVLLKSIKAFNILVIFLLIFSWFCSFITHAYIIVPQHLHFTYTLVHACAQAERLAELKDENLFAIREQHYRPASNSRIDKAAISSVSFFSQAVFLFLELSSSISSSLFFSYRYSYSYSIGT